LASATERPLVAVVGGGTLLAREIRELLSESKPAPRVQLVSATADGSTLLTTEDDEAVVMIPLNAESLDGARVAFLAASPASSRRASKLNPAGGAALINLTRGCEPLPRSLPPSPFLGIRGPSRFR